MGPTRMPYDKIVALVDHTSRLVGELARVKRDYYAILGSNAMRTKARSRRPIAVSR